MVAKGIERVSSLQYEALRDNAKRIGMFIAEIDGKDIKNMDDYLTAVWKAFRLPQTGHVNYHAYIDWICDLDWLGADACVFSILNYKLFMKELPKEREIIFRSLSNIVIPWWESGIEKFQVGGKVKPFIVYLVD